jgi:hypothetical protein
MQPEEQTVEQTTENPAPTISPEIAAISARGARLADNKTRSVALCPWCNGTGERLRDRDDLVLCNPCDGTGEADQWQGPAADDWRARRARSEEWYSSWRDIFAAQRAQAQARQASAVPLRNEITR